MLSTWLNCCSENALRLLIIGVVFLTQLMQLTQPASAQVPPGAEEISRYSGLHAAAQHLGMTQPAASKMLHELEDALGEPLFDRVGRGMRLNAAGESVMNTFRAISSHMVTLEREMDEQRLGSGARGSIRPRCAANAPKARARPMTAPRPPPSPRPASACAAI